MTLPSPLPIRVQIGTPAQKKCFNLRLFTRVADEYDLATRAMSLGQDARWKRRLLELLPVMQRPRCVDLACGTGDLTLGLAERYPDGDILGVDLTGPMLDLARRRIPHSHVQFVQADMCRLDVPDQSVDIITGGYAIRNAPVLDDALAEIHRILRPGGIAAFLDFSRPAHPLASATQLALLKCWCGLVGIAVHGRPEHAYIAESLRQFPDRLALRLRFADNGLTLRHCESFLGGITEILMVGR
jgi:demethylmenaquinone methyltransferase/2-methoxy-6-polyprenyl-1,4-benzoquinol methylase